LVICTQANTHTHSVLHPTSHAQPHTHTHRKQAENLIFSTWKAADLLVVSHSSLMFASSIRSDLKLHKHMQYNVNTLAENSPLSPVLITLSSEAHAHTRPHTHTHTHTHIRAHNTHTHTQPQDTQHTHTHTHNTHINTPNSHFRSDSCRSI